jgi:hypothetical protein
MWEILLFDSPKGTGLSLASEAGWGEHGKRVDTSGSSQSGPMYHSATSAVSDVRSAVQRQRYGRCC